MVMEFFIMMRGECKINVYSFVLFYQSFDRRYTFFNNYRSRNYWFPKRSSSSFYRMSNNYWFYNPYRFYYN